MHLKMLSIIILLNSIIPLQGCVFSCKDYLNDEIKPKKIYGQVIEKGEEDVGCFGFIVVKNSNGLDTLDGICYCVVEEQKFYDNAEIGDSLLKESDSIDIKVMKANNELLFSYPCCNY